MLKSTVCISILILLLSSLVFSQGPVLQFTLYGEKPGDNYGSAAAAGDVNGDGYADFLVTAKGDNYVKLFFGGPVFNSANHVKFEKPRTIPFAENAIGIGDINNDGYDDFAIGSSRFGYATGYQPGKIWIYYGGTAIDTAATFEIEGMLSYGTFGKVIRPAGDVNGDGYDDFLVSAPHNSWNKIGYIALILGGNTLINENIKIFQSNIDFDMYGEEVEGVGDLNGDGFDDFLVGASYDRIIDGESRGRVYIYYGNNDIDQISSVTIDDSIEPHLGCDIVKAGAITGDGKNYFFVASYNSFRLYSSGNDFLRIKNPCGPEICAGLDLNNDGKSDFIFGQAGAFNANQIYTGKIDIMLGGSIIDTIPKYTLYGKYNWEGFGGEVNPIGDINNDGYDEFAISMPTYYPERINSEVNNPIGKVEIYSFAGIVGIEKDNNAIPKGYYLYQNYPNPFNPETGIKFSIPKSEFVSLKVYNSLLQEVDPLVNESKSAGTYTVNFNAGKLPSGVYIARLYAGNYSASIKLLLIK